MPGMPGIPHFTLRWTEPEGHFGKMQHTVDVDVTTPTDHRPLGGAISTTSAGYVGRIPAGSSIGETHMVRTDADLQMATSLWKTVQDSNIRQWIPAADAAGAHLDKDAMELTIQRDRGKTEVYRTDLRSPAQPVQDVISAAGHVLAELRLHHT